MRERDSARATIAEQATKLAAVEARAVKAEGEGDQTIESNEVITQALCDAVAERDAAVARAERLGEALRQIPGMCGRHSGHIADFAKQALSDPPAPDFARHLDAASAEVAKWPEWKQRVLGGRPAPTLGERLVRLVRKGWGIVPQRMPETFADGVSKPMAVVMIPWAKSAHKADTLESAVAAAEASEAPNPPAAGEE